MTLSMHNSWKSKNWWFGGSSNTPITENGNVRRKRKFFFQSIKTSIVSR